MVGRTDWAEASTSRASGGAGPSRAVTKGGKDRWLERAVVSAKETNLLRLCNRAMITVPPAVTRCLGLTFLDVSSNSIETLPDELCGLRGLRELHLAWNKLAELPRDINQLTQLRTLCLGFNQIARLPPNLCKLRNLEILHVNDNALERLPPGIGQCTGLRELLLQYNKIERLPLQELNLRGNMLSDPPVTVVLQGARAIVEHMAKLYLEHLAREEGRGDEGNGEAPADGAGTPRAEERTAEVFVLGDGDSAGADGDAVPEPILLESADPVLDPMRRLGVSGSDPDELPEAAIAVMRRSEDEMHRGLLDMSAEMRGTAFRSAAVPRPLTANTRPQSRGPTSSRRSGAANGGGHRPRTSAAERAGASESVLAAMPSLSGSLASAASRMSRGRARREEWGQENLVVQGQSPVKSRDPVAPDAPEAAAAERRDGAGAAARRAPGQANVRPVNPRTVHFPRSDEPMRRSPVRVSTEDLALVRGVLSGRDLGALLDSVESYLEEPDEVGEEEDGPEGHAADAPPATARPATAWRPPTGLDVPPAFCCPITMSVMTDPVLAADGFTYERSAIEKWLFGGKKGAPVTSPMTGEALESKKLLQNLTLRSMIRDKFPDMPTQ